MSGRPSYATLVPSEQGEVHVYIRLNTKLSGTIERFLASFREDNDCNSERSNEVTSSRSLEKHES